MSLFTVIPLLSVISMISAQCLTGDDICPMMDPTSRTSLTHARFNFALDSLKKTALIESEDNIFFSPHSIHQAVTMAYFGARGTTEESLKRALRIPNELSKINVQRFYVTERAFNQIRSQGESADSYDYNSANRFWITSSKKVQNCMLDFLGDQLQVIDFYTNPAEVRNQINNWVSNMTKGHIRDLLSPSSITENTDLVLANAVYFKGLWVHRFDSKNSTRDIFYASGTQNSVTTFMRQTGVFRYANSQQLGVSILELPYKGNETSMFVLLPPCSAARSNQNPSNEPQDGGIHQLVERLATEKGSQELREMLDEGLRQHKVEISLPRFELERELPLRSLLHALGAGELVAPSADLRGFLADGEQSLHLGCAVHSARIEVTEEGTTAAAATVLRDSRTERVIFNANHPFVYLIYGKADHNILFTGIFRSPGVPHSTYPLTPLNDKRN